MMWNSGAKYLSLNIGTKVVIKSSVCNGQPIKEKKEKKKKKKETGGLKQRFSNSGAGNTKWNYCELIYFKQHYVPVYK